MLSITLMISEIFLLDALMSSIVDTTCPTTTPPLPADSDAAAASRFACRALSALCFTVLVSCSIDAAVCCRLDACSSVRELKSWLPAAIRAEPVAIESTL